MSTGSTQKNRHYQNFFLGLVESLQNGFVDEQVAEEDHISDLLQNPCADKEFRQNLYRQSSMKNWSLACRDMIKLNVSISYDIEKLESLGLGLSSSDESSTTLKMHDKAFKSFEFLSLDKLSLSPEDIVCFGKNDLSPIILKSGGIIDQFPSIHVRSFEGLSTFCFPHGLSMRIIPKCTTEGARNLGWVGRKADRYQLHAVSFFHFIFA